MYNVSNDKAVKIGATTFSELNYKESDIEELLRKKSEHGDGSFASLDAKEPSLMSYLGVYMKNLKDIANVGHIFL